ncbi:hypothetical protein I6E09_13550 [Mediterraneibacter glycyrrhizinilyticus]|uniref:hypothetical protein n=1 Tax=Mediterraneibacter glycyrrhizinilyticus TaxID=342942 RepID=UPI0026582C16|nr:hypothetical protein [Mediterraneibacter glycyrrhizinilyticus]MCF2570185.1 hypothetical protein [Mediterraneibacter glycyrrhizinilyticus]
MFGVGKSAEERQREKERKKRGTRKYGQANLKQSRKGVLSCINGFGGLLILAGCIFYAFMARGNAHGIVGGLAILALVLAVNGIRLAIGGFYERERNYLTCKIGLPVSFVSVIFFLTIFIGGLS